MSNTMFAWGILMIIGVAWRLVHLITPDRVPLEVGGAAHTIGGLVLIALGVGADILANRKRDR